MHCLSVRLAVPDKDGKCDDIVLGCDDAAAYEAHSSYFGGIVGRVANRIRDGKFQLNDKSYQLAQNNGGNALHGGEEGFNKKHWTPKPVANGVELSLHSPDGGRCAKPIWVQNGGRAPAILRRERCLV